MSVMRTDQWLLEAYDRPIEICEKLRGLFDVPMPLRFMNI